MNLIEKIILEAKLSIKQKKDEDGVDFDAYLGNVRVGQLMLRLDYNAWWWFEDLMDEEDYEEILDGAPMYFISHVEVLPDNQEKGIGSALMNAAIEKVKKSGVGIIVLNASPLSNKMNSGQLATWYSKFGFKTIFDQGKNKVMIKRL